MKSLLLIFFAILLSPSIPRASGLDFVYAVEKDKYIHFTAGVAISHGSYPFFRKYLKNKDGAWIYSFSLALLAGAAKELYDLDKTGFDPADLAAATLGGLTIIAVRF